MNDAVSICWIGVDWGTSRLRVWAMGENREILARGVSEAGMSGLSPDEFEPALLALVAPWLRDDRIVPVICCGMVGSRQGWVEAPYKAVPTAPVSAGHLTLVKSRDRRLNVRIIPGIMQKEPADVMRGEETQIAGLLVQQPDFTGVVCLPGTHSKWVRVKSGKIVEFSTFMTGELFSLLAEHSVLRHSIAANGWDEGAFCNAVKTSINEPARMAEQLFLLRAQSLISDLSAEQARARLSGLLIGLELGGSARYWRGQNVAVIGSGVLGNAYVHALETQGTTCKTYDVEAMTLIGLRAAASQELQTSDPVEGIQSG